MIETYQELTELEQNISEASEVIEMIHEAVTCNIARDPEKEEEIKEIYEPRLKFFEAKISEKVCIVNKSSVITLAQARKLCPRDQSQCCIDTLNWQAGRQDILLQICVHNNSTDTIFFQS